MFSPSWFPSCVPRRGRAGGLPRRSWIAGTGGGAVIIVFDVGNTETTVGVFDGELRAHWRLTSGVVRTGDEYGALLTSLIRSADLSPVELEGAAIASVVPAVTAPLADACERWLRASV